MRTKNSASQGINQSFLSDFKPLSRRSRKSLKDLRSLQSAHTALLALGPLALAFINLILQTVKFRGKCTYTIETMAKMLNVNEKTLDRKLKPLRNMNIVQEEMMGKKGYREDWSRWINPQFIKDNILINILSCLLLIEASHITNFTNVPRLYNEYIIYKKSSQAVPQLRVADGGVPPGVTTSDINSSNKLQKTEVDAIFGSVFTIPAIKCPSNTLEPAACLLSQREKMSDELIPSYILDLRSVHLTKAGQAAVSAFSKDILVSADSKLLRYKGSLRNRVGYFLKLCHELSREKNLLPDYEYAAYLHQQLGTDDTMPLMVRNAPAPQINIQKRDQAALSPHPQSTIAPGGTPPSLPSRVLLSDQETEQRRAAFMNDPEVIAGIDKLAMLMGHEHASKYFARVFDNLKIKEL